MSLISIRLPNQTLHETDILSKMLHISRTEYIRNAIEHMNKEIHAKERAEQLKKVSLRVRKESMRINREFSQVDHDPED